MYVVMWQSAQQGCSVLQYVILFVLPYLHYFELWRLWRCITLIR
jgi:hypothetical protein